ncbi:MAG: EamA family transporter [Betaproteobacteria bacterium]
MTFGGAVTFFLWIWALEHTTPSRVSVAVTLNPVSAAFLAAVLLNEPIGRRLWPSGWSRLF